MAYVAEYDARFTYAAGTPAIVGSTAYASAIDGNTHVFAGGGGADPVVSIALTPGTGSVAIRSFGQGRSFWRLNTHAGTPFPTLGSGNGGGSVVHVDTLTFQPCPAGTTLCCYLTQDGGSPNSDGGGGTSWAFDGLTETAVAVSTPPGYVSEDDARWTWSAGVAGEGYGNAYCSKVRVLAGLAASNSGIIVPSPGLVAVRARSFGRGTAILRANGGAINLATLEGGGSIAYEQLVTIPGGVTNLWVGSATDSASSHSDGLGGLSYGFDGLVEYLALGFVGEPGGGIW